VDKETSCIFENTKAKKMNTDLLKLQAKAVHEALHGDPRDAKIKELELNLFALKHEIGVAHEAVEYCLIQKISFTDVSDAVQKYQADDDCEPADFYNYQIKANL